MCCPVFATCKYFKVVLHTSTLNLDQYSQFDHNSKTWSPWSLIVSLGTGSLTIIIMSTQYWVVVLHRIGVQCLR